MNLNRVLSWIPGWLGFLLLILTGVFLFIVGLTRTTPEPGFCVVAAYAIVIGAFSWIVGGKSRVKGRVGDVGVLVEVSDLPFWAWLVDIALIVLTFVTLALI